MMASSGTAMRGEIDIQIATARAYPRSITEFHRNAMAMVTLNQHTAESCIYALPRANKAIEGPSIRLAEIVASSYQHLTIAGRVVGEDDKFIYAEGVAWDVQNNVRVLKSIRRRITDKYGKRYNDDMIAVTANAAASIAMRNAIFACVPRALVGPLYEAAVKVAEGDETTLEATRVTVLEYFARLGVSEERVLRAIGKAGIDDIGLAAIRILKGFATSIRDGEASVETVFPEKPVMPDAGRQGIGQSMAKAAGKKAPETDPPTPDGPPIDEPGPSEPEPQVPPEKPKAKPKRKAKPNADAPPADDGTPPTSLGLDGETPDEEADRIAFQNDAKAKSFAVMYTNEMEEAQLQIFRATGNRVSLGQIQRDHVAEQEQDIPGTKGIEL